MRRREKILPRRATARTTHPAGCDDGSKQGSRNHHPYVSASSASEALSTSRSLGLSPLADKAQDDSVARPVRFRASLNTPRAGPQVFALPEEACLYDPTKNMC